MSYWATCKGNALYHDERLLLAEVAEEFVAVSAESAAAARGVGYGGLGGCRGLVPGGRCCLSRRRCQDDAASPLG